MAESKVKKCIYCQVHHREGYQRGADFGDGKDSFWLFNGGRILAKRADWDFCLSSIKLNFCPMCGRDLREYKKCFGTDSTNAENANP